MRVGITTDHGGVSVCANKVPGVRAALIHGHFAARQGVEDDQMNVLCLGARGGLGSRPGLPHRDLQPGRTASPPPGQDGRPGRSER